VPNDSVSGAAAPSNNHGRRKPYRPQTAPLACGEAASAARSVKRNFASLR